MSTVTEVVRSSQGKPVVICDVSPPRGGGPGPLEEVGAIDADFLSVAYNPGQSVRVNSAFAARYIHECTGRKSIFTVATRDMNRIAIQSLLLGASWVGLHNIVVLRGDPIRNGERHQVQSVYDYTTTALLSDICRMNRGLDFRGLPLTKPTSFCPGATVDLGKGVEGEASLAARKAAAGAEFLLAQAHFNTAEVAALGDGLVDAAGMKIPLFAGVQVLALDGLDFGNVPGHVRQELDAGRPGLDIARELALELWSTGVTTFYVIPTIQQRGVRDYTTAADLVGYIRSLPVTHPA